MNNQVFRFTHKLHCHGYGTILSEFRRIADQVKKHLLNPFLVRKYLLRHRVIYIKEKLDISLLKREGHNLLDLI
jgi:hypothetical protein